MSESIRLQLEVSPSSPEVDRARWRQACQLALGLGATDADRLRAHAPATVHLALEGDLKTWTSRLERDLTRTVATSPRIQAARCQAHPVALVGERCPNCGELSSCGLCLAASRWGQCAACTQRRRRRVLFRNVRVALLLGVLVAVAVSTFTTRRRLQSWVAPLTVSVVPIAADADPGVRAYVNSLRPDAFLEVADFLARQGRRFDKDLRSTVRVNTARPVDELPPEPPEPGSSPLAIAAWSLRLRFWTWRIERANQLAPADVRIFVLFHALHAGESLDASVGLEEGHVGIVHAPAGELNEGWVQLAVIHELLHTLGATDKYGPDGAPLVPEGLGDPDQLPLYPQAWCEVMAGTLAMDASTNRLAREPAACAINGFTAFEIGWGPPRK